ncbi:hypothetical protein FS837_009413 [Tulasnella sp. UAMH 9824]|nr:hypothetical protein FS837_009413 [Tulasnella sp. UAMH 9824]
MLPDDDDQSVLGSENESDELVAPDSQGYWPIERIIKEQGKKFLVKWKGKDPKTGKAWPNDWVNKSDCSKALIREWEEEKAEKKRKGKGKTSSAGRRKSTASLPPAPSAKSRRPSAPSKRRASATKSSPVKTSPVKAPSVVIVDSDEDEDPSESESDDEPLVGQSSRKKRKVEVNGRAVAQHVTYTSSAKSKGKQPAKVANDETETETDDIPLVPTKALDPLRSRPIFGPKSVQDKALWKRQSVGSLESPSRTVSKPPVKKPDPPKATTSKTTPLPKIKLKVAANSREASNKRKREVDSEDDEKEESEEDALRTVATSSPHHRASSRTAAAPMASSSSGPRSAVKPVPIRQTEKEMPSAGASAGEPIPNPKKRSEPNTSTIGFEALRSRAGVPTTPLSKGKPRHGRSGSPRNALQRLSELDTPLNPSRPNGGKDAPSTKSNQTTNPITTSIPEEETDPWTGKPPEELVSPIRAIEPDWDEKEEDEPPSPYRPVKRQDARLVENTRNNKTRESPLAKPQPEPQPGDDDFDPLASTPAAQDISFNDDYEDVDPLADDPAPPPTAPSLGPSASAANRQEQSSQDQPSQGANTSKGTIIPDSQPERVSQSSNGTQKSTRSQSHPASAAQPKETHPLAMARSISHQEQPSISPTRDGQPIPPKVDLALKLSKGVPTTSDSLSAASRERLRAIAASGSSNGKKALGPVRNISPSVFRAIASKSVPPPEEVDDIVDSPRPSSKPSQSEPGAPGKVNTPSQESEQTDFSGQVVRERDWAAAGLKEATGPEKKRTSLDTFLKQPPGFQINPPDTVRGQGQVPEEQVVDEVLGTEKPTSQPSDVQAADIAALKARIAELESNVSTLEAQNASLVAAESTVKAQIDYIRSQYEQVSNGAAEIAIENQALDKEKRRLERENARLSQQTVTAVAQIKLTLQAEMAAVKEECNRKAHIADTLIHQARRTGIRLPADDGTEVEISADEVRRRAADWWQVKKERDELEATLEEKMADSERRETVLNIERSEEEEKKKRAIRKCKELERKLAELQSKIDGLEQQKQDQAVASEDDDVFLCEWVLESGRGGPETRCRAVTSSREACAAHILEAHVQELPLPETAPFPHSSDPSNALPVLTH